MLSIRNLCQCKPGRETALGALLRLAPNPTIERTRSGNVGLAFIFFWAKSALPPRAAHVKR
jgi:hypothetical protein